MLKIEEDKTKPFKLVKYFTFISLVVIFIGAFGISILNIHWAKSMIFKKSEDYARVLIEKLNYQVYKQFVIPVAIKFGAIQLRRPEQFELMDRVIRSTLHPSEEVEMVNIYDMDNIISYSLDKSHIGTKNAGREEYRKAIEGKTTSKLTQQGNFWKLFIGIPDISSLVTVSPLRAERHLEGLSGPILGVIEIVQDLSDNYRAIFKFQMLVILSCTIIMSIIFFILRLMVKRGENIIEKRTREKIRLKEKLAQAERLSSLGEMIAGISHEIRNPLGIIRSSAELLNKKVKEIDPNNTMPKIIVEEATRLNNIIKDFLNYAKPPSPKVSSISIEDVIKKNIEFLNIQLEKKLCDIKENIEKDLPNIMGDPDMLYQAFLNILINAVHAMPDGGSISINAYSSENFIKISFIDEGHGIKEELLGKIWEPFYTTKDMGTGLGLGIVKNIIIAHQGDITVENIKPRGAKFSIKIPYK